jgi:hypothetical protein
MASTARTSLARRLRLALAGAAVLTALTTATARAAPPAPMGSQAPATTRPGARPSPDQDPGTSRPPRGFLLDRSRFTTFDAPNATFTAPFGLNDRGQIVGIAGNPEDQASPPPARPTARTALGRL